MNPFCIAFFSEFENEYHSLKCSTSDVITTTSKIITYLEKKIKELHKWLKSYVFENEQEEIYFFKELKPKLFSKLIYYKRVLKIESGLPSTKKERILEYESELAKISDYSKNNKPFYEYHRSRASFNDMNYFIRNEDKCIFQIDSYLVNYDDNLCTSHDFIVSMIIANDLLTVYLEDKIEEIQHCKKKSKIQNSNLNWTGNKVDLTELIYALHHQKVINGGNSDIKEIAKHIGKVFNIEIEDSIYRYFSDIKNRKYQRTKFLIGLSDNLNHKIMNEEI